MTRSYIITDGQGYFVRRRRLEERIVDIWSPRLSDAARFHFLEVAERIAATIPHTVQLKRVG